VISLKNKHTDSYGIKQSKWNELFQNVETPFYFYYDKENDLKKELESYFNLSDENCEWNFHGIGYHYFEKGFFSNTYYVSCANCNNGKVSGNAIAKIAKIKIVKESCDPANPSAGFFSNNILEEKYVLWDISLEMKCDTCDKESDWKGLERVHDDGSKQHWNFSQFSDSFSRIN
jgi:hypothetical protein